MCTLFLLQNSDLGMYSLLASCHNISLILLQYAALYHMLN